MAEDPNPKTGKVAMDKAGLQAFLESRVQPFQEEVRRIALDDPVLGPAMGTLIRQTDITSKQEFEAYGSQRPLAIGQMVKAEHLHGKGEKLNQAIGKTAEELLEVYEQQGKLFKDVVDNLQTTIDTLFSAQHKSLVDIDGQEFLDIFEDVQSGLSGGQRVGGSKDKD
ncbi:type VII secretion system-associated protein [Streptomyces sp. NPDC018964]|uniref:type VII secretion system-associated protein n=1 Tax=Streptomyces sp. NPDC018964 TaxID=3365058 RepID=UPI0037B4A715